MVDLSEIRKSNAKNATQSRGGLVCVFAGATAGIGFATLSEMVVLLHSSTFYVLGRDPSRYLDKIEGLRKAGPTNKIVFLGIQVELIKEIDEACHCIRAEEEKIDIVCVSPGGMPFQGTVYTKEGLETCFVVSYYARLRIVSNLLPLIRRSRHPRVLSILNGTKEKKINEQDLGLEKNWSIIAVVNHTTLFTSLAFDHLAANNSQITFLHTTPGFVKTDTPRTAYPSKDNGIIWWALISVFQIVSGWIIQYFGRPAKESGERHAYALTSEAFPPGSWRVDKMSNIVPDNDILLQYRENGWKEIVWDFTIQVWDGCLKE